MSRLIVFCRRTAPLSLLAAFLFLRVPAALACVGDCDNSGEVTVDEVITGVNIALDTMPLSACPSFDADGDGRVTVDEIVFCVHEALNGCAEPTALPTPTPTPSPTQITTPLATATVTATSVPVAIIQTIAGSGLAGFTGDGNAAIDTPLYLPQDVTIGPTGCCISSTGTITASAASATA